MMIPKRQSQQPPPQKKHRLVRVLLRGAVVGGNDIQVWIALTIFLVLNGVSYRLGCQMSKNNNNNIIKNGNYNYYPSPSDADHIHNDKDENITFQRYQEEQRPLPLFLSNKKGDKDDDSSSTGGRHYHDRYDNDHHHQQQQQQEEQQQQEHEELMMLIHPAMIAHPNPKVIAIVVATAASAGSDEDDEEDGNNDNNKDHDHNNNNSHTTGGRMNPMDIMIQEIQKYRSVQTIITFHSSLATTTTTTSTTSSSSSSSTMKFQKQIYKNIHMNTNDDTIVYHVMTNDDDLDANNIDHILQNMMVDIVFFHNVMITDTNHNKNQKENEALQEEEVKEEKKDANDSSICTAANAASYYNDHEDPTNIQYWNQRLSNDGILISTIRNKKTNENNIDDSNDDHGNFDSNKKKKQSNTASMRKNYHSSLKRFSLFSERRDIQNLYHQLYALVQILESQRQQQEQQKEDNAHATAGTSSITTATTNTTHTTTTLTSLAAATTTTSTKNEPESPWIFSHILDYSIRTTSMTTRTTTYTPVSSSMLLYIVAFRSKQGLAYWHMSEPHVNLELRKRLIKKNPQRNENTSSSESLGYSILDSTILEKIRFPSKTSETMFCETILDNGGYNNNNDNNNKDYHHHNNKDEEDSEVDNDICNNENGGGNNNNHEKNNLSLHSHFYHNHHLDDENDDLPENNLMKNCFKSMYMGGYLNPYAPNIPQEYLKVQKSSISSEYAGRGVYAMIDIPANSYLALENSPHSIKVDWKSTLLFHSLNNHHEFYKKDLGHDLFGYFIGYGFMDEPYGMAQHAIDASVLTFVNHGCNGTANIGEEYAVDENGNLITEFTMSLSSNNQGNDVDNDLIEDDNDEEDEENNNNFISSRDIYNPFDYRNLHIDLMASNSHKDIVKGEELLDNYLVFAGTKEFLYDYIMGLQRDCSGGLGMVEQYQQDGKIHS